MSFKEGYLRLQNSREVKLAAWCDQYVKDGTMVEVGGDKNIYSVILHEVCKRIIIINDEPKVSAYLLESCGAKNVTSISRLEVHKVLQRVDDISFIMLKDESRFDDTLFSSIVASGYPPMLFYSYTEEMKKKCLEAGYTLINIRNYPEALLVVDHVVWSRKKNDYLKLSELCRRQGKYQEALDLLIKAKETKPQSNIDFETAQLYRHLGNNEEGLAACERILAKDTNDEKRNIIMGLIGEYLQPLAGKRIDLVVDIPENYHPSSPSILATEYGFLINVRLVNYVIDDDGRYHSPGNIISTMNVLTKYDKDLNQLEQLPLIDLTLGRDINAQIRGNEDLRLIDESTFMCTCLDRGDRGPQMFLGKFESSNITSITRLIVNKESRCEKNWSPFIHDGKLKFIYTWWPFRLYEINNNEMFQKVPESVTMIGEHQRKVTSDFRGSAGPVFHDGHWFSVIHQVYHDRKRKYLHRLVKASEHFSEMEVSRGFYFDKYTIEFCLGIAFRDDEMLLTYSTNDGSSRLIVVDDWRSLFV